MLIFTTDRKRLLKHFRNDPVLFAYHIGDLDDFYFADCLWPTLVGQRVSIDDVLLTYTGGATPTVLAFGLGDDFDTLLKEYLPIAPPRFFCHFQKQQGAIFHEFANETPLGTHLKMRLDESAFSRRYPTMKRVVRRPCLTTLEPDAERGQVETPDRTRTERAVRLDPSYETTLRQLYAAAYPGNYFAPRMLQTGKYFGYWDRGTIVAVAGVHVVSDKHQIAVLGNIATRPEHRGEGLATEITQVLVAELVAEGKMVCLNVKADNAPAIACYRKLGFVPVHEYEEAIYDLK